MHDEIGLSDHWLVTLHRSTLKVAQELEDHDDVIKWKYFPRYWPFVRGIHRWPVNSLHKGQWCGALMFSLIWVLTNDWVHNRNAGDLRHHGTHYDVTVMCPAVWQSSWGKVILTPMKLLPKFLYITSLYRLIWGYLHRPVHSSILYILLIFWVYTDSIKSLLSL